MYTYVFSRVPEKIRIGTEFRMDVYVLYSQKRVSACFLLVTNMVTNIITWKYVYVIG